MRAARWAAGLGRRLAAVAAGLRMRRPVEPTCHRGRPDRRRLATASLMEPSKL